MEATRTIMERFPLGPLFFMLSAGLSFLLLIPFDVLTFQANRLSFTLFINLNQFYVDFPSGLAKLFILSLVIGLFFYLFSGWFRSINHKIMQNRIRDGIRQKIGMKTSASIAERGIGDQLDFAQWARERGSSQYLTFLWALRMAVTGALYVGEFMFLFSAVVGALLLSSSVLLNVEWALWFTSTVLFAAVFYGMDLSYGASYEGELNLFWQQFAEES